jgi:hypothetical protein
VNAFAAKGLSATKSACADCRPRPLLRVGAVGVLTPDPSPSVGDPAPREKGDGGAGDPGGRGRRVSRAQPAQAGFVAQPVAAISIARATRLRGHPPGLL